MIAVPAEPTPIFGRAGVTDGDTLEIRGRRLRLWGVDVGAAMVRTDGALDSSRDSRCAYAGEQRQAEEDRIGVWSGTFQRR